MLAMWIFHNLADRLGFLRVNSVLDNSLKRQWKSILIKKVAISLFSLRNHVDSQGLSPHKAQRIGPVFRPGLFCCAKRIRFSGMERWPSG